MRLHEFTAAYRDCQRLISQARLSMRVAVCVLAVFGVMICDARASADPRARRVILVNHDIQISPRALARGARALTRQVNHDLRPRWPGPRAIVTSAKSAAGARWRVTLAAANINAPESGFHGDNRHGVWAIVYPSGSPAWTWTASHELLEISRTQRQTSRVTAFSGRCATPSRTSATTSTGISSATSSRPATSNSAPRARGTTSARSRPLPPPSRSST